jgi:hypothetical protein
LKIDNNYWYKGIRGKNYTGLFYIYKVICINKVTSEGLAEAIILNGRFEEPIIRAG